MNRPRHLACASWQRDCWFACDLGQKNLTCFVLRAKPDLLLEVQSRWLLRMCLARKSYVLRPMSNWPGVGFLSVHLGLAGPWKDAPCWLGEKLAIMSATANSSFPRGYFFLMRLLSQPKRKTLNFLICSPSTPQIGLQVLLIQPLEWLYHYTCLFPHSSLGYCNILPLVQQTSCPYSVLQPERSFPSTTPMTLFFPREKRS